MRQRLFALLIVMGTFVGLSPTAATSVTSPTDEDELIAHSTLVFTRAVTTPAAAIPAAVLLRATGIAIAPATVKDGRRYYGRGIVSARGASPDHWTPPAVIAFEGAIPLDLESDRLDFIVVAQTQRGLDYLVQRRFDSAGAHAIAAGALGHSSPVRINADLLAYTQFDAYFAGVTIDEWAVAELAKSNAKLYGRPYSTADIVRGAGFFHLPSSARRWRDTVAEYFRDMT